MKDKVKYVKSSEERIDLIIGIITVVATLALIAWLLIAAGSNLKAVGDITTSGDIRRGSNQQFTCEVIQDDIKDGEKVIWTVDGKKVQEGEYRKGEPLTLTYAPEHTGNTSVSVKVGKYKRSAMLEVLPPVLTISAPNVTVTYGEDLPEMPFTCNGFVGDDNLDNMCYDGTCAVAEYANCCENGARLNAGVYKIEFTKPCEYKDYEVNYVYGTLTVLPKQLQVENDIVKEYDQTNYIENVQLELCGIEEGDDVKASCDKLYFDNKNAGCDKTVTLANVELTGESCKNYVLPEQTYGEITPKKIELVGITVQNKTYDGTTKAQLSKVGTLEGVIDGDSVAIGSIDVSFDEAYIGEREVVCENVTLIGLDKDNYELEEVETNVAEITPY